MKALAFLLFVSLNLICLSACSHFTQWAFAQSERTASGPPQIETFTGEIVKVEGAYRFKSLQEPENLLRLTHAKKGNSPESEEVNLRKYFGKTLTVRGEVENDWILG